MQKDNKTMKCKSHQVVQMIDCCLYIVYFIILQIHVFLQIEQELSTETDEFV